MELFRGKARNDDETLVVLQREEESRLLMLGEVANSYTFGRLLRHLKKKNSRAFVTFPGASNKLREMTQVETPP